MARYCHNCGDLIEEGELFCDKCGVKLADTNESSQQNVIVENYQKVPSNDFPPNPNYSYGNPLTTSRPSKSKGIFKMVLAVFITVILTLGVTRYMNTNLNKKTEPTSSTNILNEQVEETPPENNTKLPSNETTKIDTTSNNRVAQNTVANNLAYWSADLDVESIYNSSTKRISVFYDLELINIGSGEAQDIMVFLTPEENDEITKDLGIKPNTRITADSIPRVAANNRTYILEEFYYDGVESFFISEEYLEDLSNRYTALPILVTWKENGQEYYLQLKISKI
jgi:hypothetical protein